MALSYQGTEHNRSLPAHRRIYITKEQGGFTVKHVQYMLITLCKRCNITPPNIHGDQRSLADYINNTFLVHEIDDAHREVQALYDKQSRGRSKYGRQNRIPLDITPVQDDVKATDLAVIDDPITKDLGSDAPQATDTPAEQNNPEYVLNSKYLKDMSVVLRSFDEIIKKTNVHAGRINNTDTQIDGAIRRIQIIDKEIEELKNNTPKLIEIKRPDLSEPIKAGVQHKNFPLLLSAANALAPNGHHLNIWLAGPAGTGKTTAAEKLAEIFGLKFYYNGALSTKFELVGYNDANGNYVRTAFRDAWENGGTYLFDEIDGSMPDALLSMNGALANSIASFPDKMVPRHKDCIIIAGANTTGLGGGIEYVGAMKQNAAFLNRFVFIKWPHDDALEYALCTNHEWLNRVRHVRRNVVTKQIKSHLITMRASIFGASLLAAGMDQKDVEEMTLKCGMTDAQWDMVR